MPFWRHTYNYHILLEVVNFVDVTQPVVELLVFVSWGAKNCMMLLWYNFKLIYAIVVFFLILQNCQNQHFCKVCLTILLFLYF